PHICRSLWAALGKQGDVIDAPWPRADESALVQSSIMLVVQVNGKVRSKITVAADADDNSIIEAAKADPNVAKFLVDKEIKMCKVIPNKLVTFAVK
ncbi:MAG: class I tRNA ligase family protein, partial [Cellvibrionaceae bacterium]|nr:class I tRNA ligase family protein [Cellvibrionaceae bacterium]